jgi:hypothetical protein
LGVVNHPMIGKYYDKYLDLLTKYNFLHSEIYNTDETNNPTVLGPPKVVSATRSTQVCIDRQILTETFFAGS